MNYPIWYRPGLGGGLIIAIIAIIHVFKRDAVRGAYLGPVFNPAALKVASQVSPLALFAVTLVAGLALVAWMIRKAALV